MDDENTNLVQHVLFEALDNPEQNTLRFCTIKVSCSDCECISTCSTNFYRFRSCRYMLLLHSYIRQLA